MRVSTTGSIVAAALFLSSLDALGCGCESSSAGAGGAAATGGAAGTGPSTSTSTSSTVTSWTSTAGGGSPPDAGPDAGAGGDAWIEPCDAIPASDEAVPDGYPAGAKRIQGLPPQVEVFELPPPSEPLSWAECGTGCLELRTPWAEPGKGALMVTSRGAVIEAQPWLTLRQRLVGGNILTRMGTVFGQASSALVEHEITGLVDVGSSLPLTSGASMQFVMIFYHDRYSWSYAIPPGEAPSCLAAGPGAWGPMGAAFVTDRWATAGSMNPVVTGRWPFGPGDADIELLYAPNGDELYDMAAVGERFASGGFGYDQKLRIWSWSGGTSMTELVEPADPAEDLCCAVADETTVGWIRGLDRHDDPGGRTWGRVELLTCPMPIASVPIEGTAVRRLPEDALYAAGLLYHGHFAHFGHDPGGAEYAYVVRLSDGRLWKIPPRGAELMWRKLLYLSDDEVALLEAPWGGYPPWAKTVVRYRLDSLGPGEAPN